MKVLFCDQIDKSLICDDVIDVWWNKDTKNLTFESMGSKYYIANVDFSLANSIISEFYKEEKLDMSAYEAYVNEEPPYIGDETKITNKE